MTEHSDEKLEELARLLREHDTPQQTRVRELHVYETDTGLRISQFHADGQVTIASLTAPNWRDAFDKEGSLLIDKIARRLPAIHPSQLQPQQDRIDLEYLFLRVIDDLEELVTSSDEYDLLRIAAALRLLLLDGSPLVHQANRNYRIQLRFTVGEYLPKNLPDATTGRFVRVNRGLLLHPVGDRFDPAMAPDLPATEVDFKGLLGLRVLWLTHEDFTVAEFIKHMAFVRGIVHAGSADTAKDENLAFWRTMSSAGGIPLGLSTLRAIGRVVLRGIVPLRHACRQRRANPDGPVQTNA